MSADLARTRGAAPSLAPGSRWCAGLLSLWLCTAATRADALSLMHRRGLARPSSAPGRILHRGAAARGRTSGVSGRRGAPGAPQRGRPLGAGGGLVAGDGRAAPARRRALRAARTLSAASAFSVVSSSLYLWSVLLPGLQESLGCTRASLSGVFSLATCCFTAGTSLGARLFGRTSVPAAVLATSFASALGLVAASRASSLPALALAYAGVFGTASGVAFALNAKFATSPVFAGFAGLATSVIISFRALGAPILSPATRTALAAGGASEALWQLAATIVVFSLPVAALMARTTWDELLGGSEDPPPADAAARARAPADERASLGILWLCLMLGSFPGLLAHGHAGAMVATRGAPAAVGVGAMAAGSLAGRLAAGVFCDATSPRRALIATPLLAAGALGASLLVGGVAPLVVSLGGMGLAFGVNAVAIPLETSTLFGPRGFSKAFGIIFTGWGFAGLTAPVLAGVLFDRTGGYAASVAACAASLVLAAVAAAALPRRRAAE